MRLVLLLLAALVFLLPAIAIADSVDGEIISQVGDNTDSPGDPCGTCPDPPPAGNEWGVTFKDGDMWVVGRSPSSIRHLVDCVVVETILLSGISPLGLGYDHTRDVFIVTDSAVDLVHQVDMTGAIVNTWASPGTGPVGAAYDDLRDLYWIADFGSDRLLSIDPGLGVPGPSIAVPLGTRISGAGYDPHNDLLFYHGRDQAMSYWITAASGDLVAVHPVPFGGTNNGRGATVEPFSPYSGWLTHMEQPTIFCVEGIGPTAVEQATWGSIKSVYR